MRVIGWAIAGCILVGTILLQRWFRKIEGRRRRRMLAGRPPISPEEIYETSAACCDLRRADFLKAWNAIAKILQVDPGVMRPSDPLADLDVGGKSSLKAFIFHDLYLLEQHLLARCNRLQDWREMGNLTDVMSMVRFACESDARDRKGGEKSESHTI